MKADPDAAAYAVVAHGVLTSASVIVGTAETLESGWEGFDDARRRQLVSTMGEQARTIQSVLQSLVSALPAELFAPLREAMAGQIQPVDAATAARSDVAAASSPKTSSDVSGARPHSQR